MIKIGRELEIMREGGEKLGKILQKLLDLAVPGENLLHIEDQARRLIKEAGGTPSFQTVPGYRWATCLCINEEVVHGVPKDYSLKDGDVLTIDIGLLYKGLHTDTAWTKEVISLKSEVQSPFLKTGEEALWKAIGEAKVGNRIGHISQAIQETIERDGYNIVKTLVGHGVGKELHEPPQVPGYLRVPIEQTPELVPGMTVAIEVIYAMGQGAVSYGNEDGWTIATRDRSLSAVFEHTVAISADSPEVLTKATD